MSAVYANHGELISLSFCDRPILFQFFFTFMGYMWNTPLNTPLCKNSLVKISTSTFMIVGHDLKLLLVYHAPIPT